VNAWYLQQLAGSAQQGLLLAAGAQAAAGPWKLLAAAVWQQGNHAEVAPGLLWQHRQHQQHRRQQQASHCCCLNAPGEPT
jgi:hypothetical protein